MEIWLDTANLETIKRAQQMGFLYGVTTNPTVVAKSNEVLEDLLEKILALQGGPVTVQVIATEASGMIAQGKALYAFSPRIVVKVPVTAEGLNAIHALNKENIPTMATAVFESSQALLAASAGAHYVAPYFSRICEADIDGIQVLKTMLHLLRQYKFNAKLIAASLRTPEQVRECCEMGAHAVTLNEKVFADFIQDHPLTTQSVQRFAKDWETAKKRKSLPL
ncbi:MAG: fructose-6-phosphate aldolase [Verrucomicrobiota bacterium]|nr:fructose-6-phosphate aldolase [Verrucomicrobiota bacterium]